MFGQLKGLVALVTGGYSGLGLAVCKRLADSGAKVVALDLRHKIDKLDNVVAIKGDIRKEADIAAALKRCADESGANRLDVLVNCAGVGNAFRIYNFLTDKPQRLSDFVDCLDVNVCGTFNVIRLAVQLMAANQLNSGGCRGVIVNASSILAYEGHEGQAGYSASQMAINSMTLPIARELAETGIRCNTIACGFFETPLILREEESPLLAEYITYATPCPRRLGRPDEFAALVQTIIENQMINGEIIRLDAAVRWPERD